MTNLIDTIMNVEIFLFLGFLVWLYVKPIKMRLDDSRARTGEEKEID